MILGLCEQYALEYHSHLWFKFEVVKSQRNFSCHLPAPSAIFHHILSKYTVFSYIFMPFFHAGLYSMQIEYSSFRTQLVYHFLVMSSLIIQVVLIFLFVYTFKYSVYPCNIFHTVLLLFINLLALLDSQKLGIRSQSSLYLQCLRGLEYSSS